MKSLKDVFLSQKPLKPLVNSCTYLSSLKAQKDTLFGKLSPHFDILFLKGDCLYIQSRNQLWVKEIEFYKPLILTRCKEIIGKKNVVKNVKVMVDSSARPQKKQTIAGDALPEDFSEKIKFVIESRKKLGWRLCSHCQKVLTPNALCDFCRIESQKPGFSTVGSRNRPML